MINNCFFAECKLNINSNTINQNDLDKRTNSKQPYWSNDAKIISSKLWLPENINKTNINAFQSKNKFIAYESKFDGKQNNYIALDIEALSNEGSINYTRKVRIYPTKSQKEVFKTCMHGANYYYNLAIDYINNIQDDIIKDLKIEFDKLDNYVSFNQAKFIIEKSKKIPSYRIVRDKIIERRISNDSSNAWLKAVPDHTKAEAIHDLMISFETNIKQYMRKLHNTKIKSMKSNTILKEVIKFILNKRVENITFHIENRQIQLKDRILMPRRTKNDKFGISHREFSKIKKLKYGDSRIVFTKPNRWYLCLSLKRDITNNHKQYNNVSLDPGVRAFQSFYSTNGVIGKLGQNVNKKLYNLHLRIDKMISKIDNCKLQHTRKANKKAYRMKKRVNTLRERIKNLVAELHHKSANYLTNNFKTIIIPNTNTSSMVNNETSNLNSQTKRSLMSLSHYKFREYLKWLAKSRNNQVIEVSEAYTSKTCGNCGIIHSTLGGNKIFDCASCGYCLDRDIHGARNILVRALTFSGVMQSLGSVLEPKNIGPDLKVPRANKFEDSIISRNL